MIFDQIKEKIEKFDTIIIFRHIQPDGDAYGSTFGLKRLININYPDKEVYVLGTKGQNLELFFGKHDEVSDDKFENALVISCDLPNMSRVDGEQFKLKKEVIKIDHHIFVENFGGIDWVDTNYSSTCEMVADLAIHANWKIDEISATFLYFGIVTDSGRFLYSHNTNIFNVCSKLVECGADVDRIYPFIYEQEPSDVRFRGLCQAYFKTTCYGVGYNFLTPEVLKSYNIPPYQGAGMVNALSSMKNIDVWAHFSENDDGTVRGELRSKGLPVNLIANEFGGGGHKQAAGCTLLNWDEAKLCLDKLDNMLFESKPYHQQIKDGLEIIKEANKIALEYYSRQNFGVETKDDDSPVTTADLKVNEYVIARLKELYPDYGLLSEELADDKERLDKEYVWILDPIDGTKDFIAHDGEFSIILSLVRNHKVVAGIISVPALHKIYYAMENGGAYKLENNEATRIFTNKKNSDLTALTSHFHVSEKDSKFLVQFSNLFKTVSKCGSAYKFCQIAEGNAEFNLKLGKGTKEWDIAAGVIIVKEAGGSFTKPDGTEYEFNREYVYNDEGFIVMNQFNKGLLAK